MIRTCVAAALLLAPISATAEGHGGAVSALLKAAEAECRAEAALSGDGAPAPQLDIRPAAVTWVDLDGDELKDDAIVDFNAVLCPVAYTLWAGTGGSLIHLVLDDQTTATFTGGTWQLLTFRFTPVVLIGRHGTYCDSYGGVPCIQAITASDGQFLTPVLEAGPFVWP